MKKSAVFILLAYSTQLSAITSNMTHRVMGTSPLLYKMIDYSKRQTSFEVEPIYSSMYDTQHTVSNLTPEGKQTLVFNQQGGGDVNPVWLNLMSNNSLANYYSTVTFEPTLAQSGMLFHWYDQFETTFIDIKTALVQCTSEIEITEVGGGNGSGAGIANAQQAFSQESWNFGKMGQANHVVGLDNVELRFGKVVSCTSDASSYDMLMSAFGIIEAPTGTGTKAEWLFEPQVGTNHWGLGFGFEALVSGDDDLKFMIAGNYRYLTPAWETRSFDLLGNGSWSRYLAVQDTYGLPTAPPVNGLPGINYFTQQAYLNGRSELNLYARLAKQFHSSYFEISYNFFCIQQETIGTIKNLPSGFGIYSLTGPAGGSGGATTSSNATINEDVTPLDPLGSPVAVTVNQFDKLSACAGAFATNTVTARFEIKNNKIVYGFGASIEAAQSASAISSWAVWAKFEYLFDNIGSSHDEHEFPSEFYDYDATTANIVHHPMDMDEANLPKDVITSIENDFIEDIDGFEFEDDTLDFSQDEIDALEKKLNISAIEIADNMVHYSIEEANKALAEDEAKISKPIEVTVDSDKTVAIEHEHINQEQENSIKIEVPEDTTQTISLEDHPIVPQTENGILLINNDSQSAHKHNPNLPENIQHHEVEAMSHEEIQTFLKHDATNATNSLSEEEILNKLDSTK